MGIHFGTHLYDLIFVSLAGALSRLNVASKPRVGDFYIALKSPENALLEGAPNHECQFAKAVVLKCR